MTHPRDCSLYPSEGVDSDFGCAGGEQGFRALVDRGAGGENIINEERPATLHLLGPGHLKGPLHICLPRSPPPALSLGGPNPTQQAVPDATTPPSLQLLRQERRLVEASFLLPTWMKRDRDQEVELEVIEQSSGRHGHQTTQMTTQRGTPSVLEQ